MFGNTFRWRLVSYRDQPNWTAFRIKWLFTEKISKQTFICYVLNIVNNGKNLFIYLFIYFYYLFHVPVDRRRNFDILSKPQITRFLLLVSWVWVGFD